MKNVKDVNHEVKVAKENEVVIVKRQGDLVLQTEEGKTVTLTDVLECENLAYNLLSVKKIEEKGSKVIFEKGEVNVVKDSVSVMKGKVKGNLYRIRLRYKEEIASVRECGEKKRRMLVHRKIFRDIHQNIQ